MRGEGKNEWFEVEGAGSAGEREDAQEKVKEVREVEL